MRDDFPRGTKSRPEKGSSRVAPLADTARRLNARGLAWLSNAMQTSNYFEQHPSWREIVSVWTCASDLAIERAAQSPMVLFDFNFQRGDWWRRVTNAPSCEEFRRERAVTDQTDDAVLLAHDLLLEAWSAARVMPRVASLVFGMAPEVTALIARLSPRELDRAATHEIREMGPRWANRPTFWRDLFEAASSEDDEILANVYLHSLQLLGGELVLAQSTHLSLGSETTQPLTYVSVQERVG
jgi:hypothetical protein